MGKDYFLAIRTQDIIFRLALWLI